MTISEKRVEEILPQNIKDSELLSLASKKVLAALLDWYLNSEAKTTKVVIISNKILCSIAGVGGTSLQESLRELNDYNLVTRTIGTKLGDASKYYINFKNLVKPLKKKTFDDMFSEELEEVKSQENPISTIVENSIVKNSIVKNSIVKNSIEKNSIEKNSIEQNSIENKTVVEATNNASTTSDNNTYTTFQKLCGELLECQTEVELIVKKASLASTLTKKQLEIPRSVYCRCLTYLNERYTEQLQKIDKVGENNELEQAESSTVEDEGCSEGIMVYGKQM